MRDVAPAFLLAGYTFAPFIMEFYGGFHETALQEIREVAEEIARVRGLPASQVAAFWKKALAFTLHTAAARSLLFAMETSGRKHRAIRVSNIALQLEQAILSDRIGGWIPVDRSGPLVAPRFRR